MGTLSSDIVHFFSKMHVAGAPECYSEALEMAERHDPNAKDTIDLSVFLPSSGYERAAYQPFMDGSSPSYSQRPYWFIVAYQDMLNRCFSHPYKKDLRTGWARWSTGPLESMERSVIVNSLHDVCEYLGISRYSFFSAVALLDHYLSVAAPTQEFLNPDNFRCIVILMAYIAAKLHDVYPPIIRNVIRALNSNSVSNDRLFHYELYVLDNFSYFIHPVTLYDALRFFESMPLAPISEQTVYLSSDSKRAYYKQLSFLRPVLMTLGDILIRDDCSIKYNCLVLALAAYQLALEMLRLAPSPSLTYLARDVVARTMDGGARAVSSLPLVLVPDHDNHQNILRNNQNTAGGGRAGEKLSMMDGAGSESKGLDAVQEDAPLTLGQAKEDIMNVLLQVSDLRETERQNYLKREMSVFSLKVISQFIRSYRLDTSKAGGHTNIAPAHDTL